LQFVESTAGRRAAGTVGTRAIILADQTGALSLRLRDWLHDIGEDYRGDVRLRFDGHGVGQTIGQAKRVNHQA
jgi:hypothetical protein